MHRVQVPVLWIRIHRIHLFLGLQDPDPSLSGSGSGSCRHQAKKRKKNLGFYSFVTRPLYDFLSLKTSWKPLTKRAGSWSGAGCNSMVRISGSLLKCRGSAMTGTVMCQCAKNWKYNNCWEKKILWLYTYVVGRVRVFESQAEFTGHEVFLEQNSSPTFWYGGLCKTFQRASPEVKCRALAPFSREVLSHVLDCGLQCMCISNHN
jgi:hypothetical protein